MRTWWIFAALVACGDAGRAQDCDQLAAMLHSTPRRYYEASGTLAAHEWENPDVRAAVEEFLAPSRIAQAGRDPMLRYLSRGTSRFKAHDTGWTLYTPYAADSDPGGPIRVFDDAPRTSRFAALRQVCPAISLDP